MNLGVSTGSTFLRACDESSGAKTAPHEARPLRSESYALGGFLGTVEPMRFVAKG